MKVLNYKRLGHIPAGARYIGRSMPRLGLVDEGWGNSHRMRDERDRDRVCDAHERDVRARIAREPAYAERIMTELAGRDLVCWCDGERQRCHGHTYIKIVGELRSTRGSA